MTNFYKPKHRADTEADKILRAYAEMQQRASERNKVRYKEFEKPYCQDFSDCLDGFVIHAPECRLYQQMAISSSRDCIDYRYVSVWPAGLAQVR